MRHAIGLVLALVVCGCGATRVSHVMTGTARPPTAGAVTLYMESAPPPADFQEIALIQAVGHGGHADMEHAIEGLRRVALSLGCTTIVRIHIDQGASVASANGVCGVVP